MLNRYFIKLAYKGTHYHGWQYQPNALTVQEVLNKSVRLVIRQNVEITGCGRTDTGVHATKFFAHFDADLSEFDLKLLAKKLNSFLPRDIVIYSIFKVDNSAHSRFDALSRKYRYIIEREKNPFELEFAWQTGINFDIVKMRTAAKLLFNYTDFTSFSKLHTDTKTNNCKIITADFFEEGSKIIFEIAADRFLRNMVRAVVGTLADVGKHKCSIDEFKQIIESKNRNNAGLSVPACGLFLIDVVYPSEVVSADYA